MEPNSMHVDQQVEEEEGQEEYVLLDLGSVPDIPPNAPYVLSGLDTLNPVLMIGDTLKLIGHYEETIGTGIIFSENDVSPEGPMEMGPSQPNKVHRKEVTPVASLTKILKFRLCPDINIQDETMTP